MKQRSIDELQQPLPGFYENIFNVYLDKDSHYFYNLLETVKLPTLPAYMFNIYNVEPKDTWPFISYKAYNNTIMWWLILLTNNIINPVIQPQPGTTLKILKQEYVSYIISSINS